MRARPSSFPVVGPSSGPRAGLRPGLRIGLRGPWGVALLPLLLASPGSPTVLGVLGSTAATQQEQGSDPEHAPQEGPRFETSDDTVTRALAALDAIAPGAVAAVRASWRPETVWPAWDDRSPAGWGGERPWRHWLELVRAEARREGTTADSARRRAELALAALLQDRPGDAWSHLLAAGDSPFAAAVRPAFLPGRAVDELGDAEALAAGTTLTPFLPPPRRAPTPSSSLEDFAAFRGRSTSDHDVRIGDTHFELTLQVDEDGVQIGLLHRSGPEVLVRVRPPLPPGVTFQRVFADWEEAGEGDTEVAFRVGPAEPEHTLWARLEYRRESWPEGLDRTSAASADSDRPLILVVPSEEQRSAFLQRLAEALEELLGRSVSVSTPDNAARRAEQSFPAPRSIHLGRSATGEAAFTEAQLDRDLARLLSRIERHVLLAPRMAREGER